MKDQDKQALQYFNPDRNLYLSLNYEDPFFPFLKVRNCTILSFPFFGRIFRWLGCYTTKPFEKVISYLLSEQSGLHQEENIQLKEKIKLKIDHYFFDKKTQKPKHQKLWNKVKEQYEKCFNKQEAFQPVINIEKEVKEKKGDKEVKEKFIEKKEKEEVKEKFNQSTDWTFDRGLNKLLREAPLPDSIQQILPKANYYIAFTPTIRIEFTNEKYTNFIDESKRKNDYPCIFIIARYGLRASRVAIDEVPIRGETYPCFQLYFEGNTFCDEEINIREAIRIRNYVT